MNIKKLAQELSRIELSHSINEVLRELRNIIQAIPTFRIRKVRIDPPTIYFTGTGGPNPIRKHEQQFKAIAKKMGGKLIKSTNAVFFIETDDFLISFQPDGTDLNGEWYWIAKVDVEE